VMTARIATGRAVSPRLIRAIDGQLLPVPDAPTLDIDAGILRAVQLGMYEVTMGARGTAKSSRIVDETMTMAGKTGTSQVRNITAAERARGVVSNDDLPWERRDHALFVGYAPFDNPKYAVSVVVEHGGGGSLAAAPIARDIILRAMTGGMPPLEAYPQDQRGRIETLLKELVLRPPSAPEPGASRA
jgi:penicillin-binding protein 2